MHLHVPNQTGETQSRENRVEGLSRVFRKSIDLFADKITAFSPFLQSPFWSFYVLHLLICERCSTFVAFFANIHTKSVNFCLLGNSGFDSYVYQYMQKVHTYVRTFAISRIHITISRRLNYSSIKQTLNMYVAQRFAPVLQKTFAGAKVLLFFYICKFYDRILSRKWILSQ